MTQAAPHPRMHGLTHVTGGPDPIPGLLPIITGSYQEQVLAEPSLIGYWPLDDDGPVAADHSTSGHDLDESADPPTWRQPGPFTDPDATSVLFSHASGFTAATDALVDSVSSVIYYFNDVDPYTWEVLAYPTGLATSGHVASLMDMYEPPGGSSEGMYMAILEDGSVRVGRAGVSFDSPVALTLNEWVHLAMSYDGATLRLYFDGEEQLAEATTASHGGSGQLSLGQHYAGTTWRENYTGRLAQAAIYNQALSASTIARHANLGIGAGGGQEGWVLELDENGNPHWVPPGEVTVDGDDNPHSFTRLPPFTTLPTDPDTIDPSEQWMMEQPFCWSGPEFEVPPKKWTTIPFSQPLMERQSNVAGGSTTWFELDPDDPSSAGWVDPARPHSIIVPHDMPFLGDVYSWMQICLKLEVPAVEEDTSQRVLRIFEATHQKPLLVSGDLRSEGGVGHGAKNVYRDQTAPGWTPFDGELFAQGDPGGEHAGEHGNIMFIPATLRAYYLPGLDWLPRVAGQATLKQGMRLVAQVWHDATVPLTFDCTGVAPWRPHFMFTTPGLRAWGPPWSDWPEA